MSAERGPTDRPLPRPITIRNGVLVTPGGLERQALTVDGKYIASHDEGAADTVDAEGLLVAPGFIDLQINGGHGLDLWSSPESMWDLAALLPRYGVTAFLPTIVSGPPELANRAIDALAHRPGGHVGAEPLGLHLEGPMLAPEHCGAHDAGHLVPPHPSVVQRWSRDRGVAMVTLAPELPGAGEVIGLLRDAGVVVSAGHTGADADAAARAVADGVGAVTHLFNAMALMHHRRPGLAGFVLGHDSLIAGLIVDGVHLDPLVVSAAWRALGPNRLVLVSDAVAAMGLGPGTHRLGGMTVTADERAVRRHDGTLAGSKLTLDAAVRNLVAFARCRPEQAVATVTSTPARLLGCTDRGRLEPGSVADLVLLDADLRVVMTLCAGRVVHLAPEGVGRLSGVSAPPPTPD